MMIKTLTIGTALALAAGAASAQTLQEVKDRGELRCGISTALTGFATPDEAGRWEGFDVAFCRAVAAAVLGDPEAVAFTPLTTVTRFEALSSGEIDLLSRNTTYTYSRDTDLNFNFAGVNYYDGQGFIVPAALGVSSATELDGATVCIQTGTTTELNLADFFRANGISYEPVPVETATVAQLQYLAGACDAYTTDRSGLAAVRATFENPEEHVILPDVISKEPLGPLVRHGDEEWSDVARWVLYAQIAAEEFGVTRDNVQDLAANGSENAEVNRLLGREDELGAMLGLPSDWAVKVIAAVGNYGEIYDEHLAPLGLERGLNALWTDGGLMYAMPFR